MAFGSEILLLMGAGFVVLGPKRMQSMLGQIGRAKAQFDRASRSFLTEVSSSLDENPCSSERIPENDIDDSALILPDELIEKIANHNASNR